MAPPGGECAGLWGPLSVSHSGEGELANLPGQGSSRWQRAMPRGLTAHSSHGTGAPAGKGVRTGTTACSRMQERHPEKTTAPTSPMGRLRLCLSPGMKLGYPDPLLCAVASGTSFFHRGFFKDLIQNGRVQGVPLSP